MSFDFEKKRVLFKDYYGENITHLEDAKNSMVTLLTSIFPSTGEIQVSKIEGRVKDRNECIEKFKEKYQSKLEAEDADYLIQDHISDLIGIRIVCLYEDMVPQVRKSLEDIFDVIEVTDKISEIEGTDNSFGYKGLHLDVRLNSKRRKLPEYSRFSDFKFEIQLRTVIQDSWSSLDHKIKYKKIIPLELKRRINTLAALFELADHEFVAIRNKTSEEANNPSSNYQSISKETPDGIEDRKLNVGNYHPLDVFSFLKIAQHFFPNSDFRDETVDDFVEKIVSCSPGISRGKFNFFMKSNISNAKKFLQESLPDGSDLKDFPMAVISVTLIMGDVDVFGSLAGPRALERIDEFIKRQ